MHLAIDGDLVLNRHIALNGHWRIDRGHLSFGLHITLHQHGSLKRLHRQRTSDRQRLLVGDGHRVFHHNG